MESLVSLQQETKSIKIGQWSISRLSSIIISLGLLELETLLKFNYSTAPRLTLKLFQDLGMQLGSGPGPTQAHWAMA